jgi:integrase
MLVLVGSEIARRCLGHRDARTTRRAYTQQQHRAAQLRYLEMLESRRLLAFRHGMHHEEG